MVKSLKYTLSIIFSFIICYSQGQDATSEKEDYWDLSLDELMNLEVSTASKSIEGINDAPGIITVITSDEIKSFGGMNLVDVLERVPGLVPMSSYFFAHNMLSVRGDLPNHNDSHTLILINGRPVRFSRTGGLNNTIFTSFPLKLIDRIEVVRGPGSVLYGSNAYSGVINIITKSEEKNFIDASIGYGAYGTLTGDLTYSHLFGKDLKLHAGLNYFNEDGWEQNVVDEFGNTQSASTSERNMGLMAGLAYKGLTLNTLFTDSDLASLGFIPKWPMDVSEVNLQMIDLGYNWKLKPSLSMNFNATYNGYNWTYPVDRPGSTPENITNSINTTNDYLFEFSASKKFKDNVNLILGGTGYSLNGVEPDDYSLFWWNVYFQSDIKITDNIKLIAGGQFNKPETSDLDFVPRLGAVVSVNDQLGIKALYSQAFRSPYYVESFVAIPNVLMGNADLKPEKVKSFDFQVYYNTEKFQSNISVFRNKQEDLINRVAVQGETFQTFDNDGERLIMGLEFESKYVPSSKLLISSAFTYTKNEDGNGVEGSTFAPAFTAKLGASYKLTDGFNVGIFNTYVSEFGKISVINPGVNEVNPEADGYNLLSANLTLNVGQLFNATKLTNFGIDIYASNILDKDVFIPETTRKRINTIQYRGGAALYAKLTYRLQK
ncbi:TonB-dependent receptor [Fulvivirgaceae bacterium BMA10]|uniref:TonB-dependent receptor n=1 Tax=Splendidivirga corallicola TaxID=3051826 RepID=A0ABT8KSB6_9BACT|nr:TonB-dependent receptor [Fulvivirgaceae bacterium BMA10]